jgi:hypothetical protein
MSQTSLLLTRLSRATVDRVLLRAHFFFNICQTSCLSIILKQLLKQLALLRLLDKTIDAYTYAYTPCRRHQIAFSARAHARPDAPTLQRSTLRPPCSAQTYKCHTETTSMVIVWQPLPRPTAAIWSVSLPGLGFKSQSLGSDFCLSYSPIAPSPSFTAQPTNITYLQASHTYNCTAIVPCKMMHDRHDGFQSRAPSSVARAQDCFRRRTFARLYRNNTKCTHVKVCMCAML